MSTPAKQAVAQELVRLNRNIDAYPDAAINYLLRGEFWLKLEQTQQALPDLVKAIELAELERNQSPWEYREQAVIDRAETLLRLAQ